MKVRPPRSGLRLQPMLCALAWLAGAAAAEPATDHGAELRLRWDARHANRSGPLATAALLAPGIAAPAPRSAVADLELHGTWRPADAAAAPLSLSTNALLQHEHPEGGPALNEARFNELHASADLGAWQASAGKKIVGWDVGHGFRPNDVVQQEERRSLLAVTPEGRPLLQLEHFGAETAATLVWVNPQRLHRSDSAQRFGDEGALAARVYRRAGAADWHGFARHGSHTGTSLGAALAWVAGDELELHASVRALQRHDQPAAGNPWRAATRGSATQWLLGASWTGRQQQSLLAEGWHDGTALPDAEWDRWQARNTVLAATAAGDGTPQGLRTALAGTLAWQATPFAATSLRRDNLFLLAAWQPGPWQLWADLLHTPADGGRACSTGLQWQGDHWRLTAALRSYGGPSDAVLAQLPQRRTGVLAASRAW
jgi:hypothetical protein